MKLRSRTLRKIVPRDLPRPIKVLGLRFAISKKENIRDQAAILF